MNQSLFHKTYLLGKHKKSVTLTVLSIGFFMLSLWSRNLRSPSPSDTEQSIVDAVIHARDSAFIDTAIPVILFLTGSFLALGAIKALYKEMSVYR